MNLSFDKDHVTVSYNYSLQEFHEMVTDYYNKSSFFYRKSLCAPPTELFKIASQLPHKDYREDIYRVVLYYGTQCYHHLDEAQKEAIWECFLALPPDCEVNRKSREKFVNFHLDLAIKNENTVGVYVGKTWEEFCKEFREENIAIANAARISKVLLYWSDTLAKDFLEKLKGSNVYERILEERNEDFEIVANSLLKALGLTERTFTEEDFDEVIDDF